MNLYSDLASLDRVRLEAEEKRKSKEVQAVMQKEDLVLRIIRRKDLPSESPINENFWLDEEKRIHKRYTNNPVYHDAAAGNATVEESLRQAGQIYKGLTAKFLPVRTNANHDRRVSGLCELLQTAPDHLYTTGGILRPDNPLALTAYFFAGTYFLASTIAASTAATGSDWQEISHIPYYVATIVSSMGPVAGTVMAILNKRGRLAYNEARILDKRIKNIHSQIPSLPEPISLK